MSTTDKTRLSYWFPMLADAGIPVPRTVIVVMPEDVREAIVHAMDGRVSPPNDGLILDFIDRLKLAAAAD